MGITVLKMSSVLITHAIYFQLEQMLMTSFSWHVEQAIDILSHNSWLLASKLIGY